MHAICIRIRLRPHDRDRQCWLCAPTAEAVIFRDLMPPLTVFDDKFLYTCVNWLVQVLHKIALRPAPVKHAFYEMCRGFLTCELVVSEPKTRGIAYWRDTVSGIIHLTVHGRPRKPVAFRCLGHLLAEKCHVAVDVFESGDFVSQLLDGVDRLLDMQQRDAWQVAVYRAITWRHSR